MPRVHRTARQIDAIEATLTAADFAADGYDRYGMSAAEIAELEAEDEALERLRRRFQTARPS